jgi:hypothetical protein
MASSICRAPSAIALTVLLVLTGSSCRKKQVAVPVPLAPAAEAPQQEPTQAPPMVTHPAIEPAPAAPTPAQSPPAKDESRYQKSRPADAQPPPKHVARPSTPAPVQPSPAPTNTAPAETPQLGDILSPEQQHQFNAAIDLSVAHAQTSLSSITNRQLTREQEATVAQVLNFIQQAQEKRKNELGAAKSLAERAEVLAHDLAASLR